MRAAIGFPLKGIAAAAFTVAAILLFSRCEVPPADGGGGSDTTARRQPDTAWYADNPEAAAFDISTADELAGLALLVNSEGSPVDFAGKTVRLIADIDLSGRYGRSYNNEGGDGWVSIGTLSPDKKTSRPFKGIFDGNGKVISGLYMDGNTFHNFKGLFGRIDGDAVLKNFSLANVNINGGTGLGGVVGSAAGNSKVVNCHVKGVINGNHDVGGVAGEINGGKISGCSFAGTVKTRGANSGSIGGIAGIADDAVVENCYTLGDIVSGYQMVGGVVGSADAKNATDVANCYSAISVSGSSGSVGGVVGYIYNNTRVTDCAALNKSVKDTENYCVGRIVGCYEPNTGVTLSGNIAFAGMEGGAVWDSIGGADRDGENITKEAVNADGTLGGRFNAAGGWTTEAGKLPGLGGSAVDMPEHLK